MKVTPSKAYLDYLRVQATWAIPGTCVLQQKQNLALIQICSGDARWLDTSLQ